MKFRADKFIYIAEEEDLMKIQEQTQFQAAARFDGDLDVSSANSLLLLYLQVAYDEGYRRVMADLKQTAPYAKDNINIVERKLGWFEYIEDVKTVKGMLPLVRRRIKSKRQRAYHKKSSEEQGREFEEEYFMISMIIHTGFEQGYAKADSFEETAKIICKNQEMADLTMELFGEMLKHEVSEELNE